MTASSRAPAPCSASRELATDPRFLKNNDRVVHGKEIMAIFAGLFLKKPVAYWLDELEKAGVPSGPINDFAQVFADPHVQSRGMQVKVEHPFEPDAVADPQRHHLLRHPGEGLSRAAAARRGHQGCAGDDRLRRGEAGSAEGAEDRLAKAAANLFRDHQRQPFRDQRRLDAAFDLDGDAERQRHLSGGALFRPLRDEDGPDPRT